MTHRAGLPDYDRPSRFPELVWRAVENTRRDGFELACVPEVGRLLQLLAGSRGVKRICELGTAYGVGTAWIQSGMRPTSTLVTVEVDRTRSESARELFRSTRAVEVLTGDWTSALDRRPFDLLFSDGGPKRKPGDPEKLLNLLSPGAIVVLDDYTPRFGPDVSRDIWLENPAYRAVELTLTSDMAVILAVKR